MELKRISSPANTAVKEAARLKRKRHRYEHRLFLTEGEDLLDAALLSGVIPRQVFVLEGQDKLLSERLAGVLSRRARHPEVIPANVAFYICSPAVLEKLTGLGSGTRVIAVFEMLDRKFPAEIDSVFPHNGHSEGAPAPRSHGDTLYGAASATGESAFTGPVPYLAGVKDPGNVGTLVRSAAALGAPCVLLGPGTADPYSPKSLRATMGAIFQIPLFLEVGPGELVSWAGEAGINVVCADARSGGAVWRAHLEGAFVLVMGSEREGIPDFLKEAAAEIVCIPQSEGMESINVAMAGTVVMYESLRQRREKMAVEVEPQPEECSCEKTAKPHGQETPGRT